MGIQALRDELAEIAPEGYYGYGSTPGLPELPAVMVGLPTSVNWDNSPRPVVTLPVLVLVPGVDDDSEVAVVDAGMEVAEALRAETQGTYYSGLRVTGIEEFGQTSFGEGTVKCLGARLIIELRVSRTQPEAS